MNSTRSPGPCNKESGQRNETCHALTRKQMPKTMVHALQQWAHSKPDGKVMAVNSVVVNLGLLLLSFSSLCAVFKNLSNAISTSIESFCIAETQRKKEKWARPSKCSGNLLEAWQQQICWRTGPMSCNANRMSSQSRQTQTQMRPPEVSVKPEQIVTKGHVQ